MSASAAFSTPRTSRAPGLAKVFLGSVAGRVVAIAPCPVMTVRGK